MKTPVITIGGRTGCIFEGEIPQTFCFVPEELITAEADSISVPGGAYVRSGWDVRNMRFNDEGEGEHLFPNPRRPVSDLEGPLVRSFIRRIEIVQPA